MFKQLYKATHPSFSSSIYILGTDHAYPFKDLPTFVKKVIWNTDVCLSEPGDCFDYEHNDKETQDLFLRFGSSNWHWYDRLDPKLQATLQRIIQKGKERGHFPKAVALQDADCVLVNHTVFCADLYDGIDYSVIGLFSKYKKIPQYGLDDTSAQYEASLVEYLYDEDRMLQELASNILNAQSVEAFPVSQYLTGLRIKYALHLRSPKTLQCCSICSVRVKAMPAFVR